MFVHAHIVNAFIDSATGGNPAGVVLDADRLTQQQKQWIAASIGVSETAFVSQSMTASFKLEFFTPTRQIAHCGHATVAAFALLKQSGAISDGKLSKETIDGNRDILVQDGMVFMEQRAPKYQPLSSVDFHASLEALNIQAADLYKGINPCIVNTGTSFLVIPLKNAKSVANLSVNLEAIHNLSKKMDLIGFYAFSLETQILGRIAGVRMFAPAYGIDEEAATGMAAGQLACFLRDHMGLKQQSMLIEQGYLMSPPSPSIITVNLDIQNGAIQKLMAGGHAKVMKYFSINLQPILLHAPTAIASQCKL